MCCGVAPMWREASSSALMSTSWRIGYWLRVENADGQHVIEPQAYYEPDGEQIGRLRIMCAGFLPMTD
jgi:hypothetical protein